MNKIDIIEKELIACKSAWESSPKSKWAWCCHHEIRMEPLTEPWKTRVDYILNRKFQAEQAIRLRNFRPVRIPLSLKINKAYAEYRKAYAEYSKTNVEWHKAVVEYDKAEVEYSKANVKWCKVNVKWRKADAEYDKAWAERRKARVKWCKAYAEYDKAWAEYSKARVKWTNIHHNKDWTDNTWNTKTGSIFK